MAGQWSCSLASPAGVKYGVFVLDAPYVPSSAGHNRFVNSLHDAFRQEHPDLLDHIFWDCKSLDVLDTEAAATAKQLLVAALEDALLVLIVLSAEFLLCTTSMAKLSTVLRRLQQGANPKARVVPMFCGGLPDLNGITLPEGCAATWQELLGVGLLDFAGKPTTLSDNNFVSALQVGTGATELNNAARRIAQQVEQVVCSLQPAAGAGHVGKFSAMRPLGEPQGKKYGVFVSHSGKEKADVVEWLSLQFSKSYPALNVFVDWHSLKPGDRGYEEMRDALEDAPIGIVVVSQEYLRSPSAMDELFMLLQRQRANPNTAAQILPVFYKVSWHQVWSQVLKYEALVRDAGRCIVGTMPSNMTLLDSVAQQYADDLKDLARFSGFTGYYAGGAQWYNKQVKPAPLLILEIVERTAEILAVMGKLPTQKDEALPTYCVGLQAGAESGSQLAGLLERATRAAAECNATLLHGMPGVGKTTQAKALFNKVHSQQRTMPACFLKSPKPYMELADSELVVLQDMLLTQLARSDPYLAAEGADTAKGRAQLAKCLQGQRVLLVVDGFCAVGSVQVDQLLPSTLMEVLAPGSIVLVTSRGPLAGSALLRGCVLEHEVQCLADEHSRDLLLHHAGSRGQELSGQLVNKVLQHCAGLPAALEAAGKHISEKLKKSLMSQEPPVWDVLDTAYWMDISARAGWEALKDTHTHVMDIEWFLRGEGYRWVDAYCSHGWLEQLLQAGLVRSKSSFGVQQDQQRAEAIITVHPVISDFCREYEKLKELRQNLKALQRWCETEEEHEGSMDDDGNDERLEDQDNNSLKDDGSGLAKQVEAAEGLLLHGFDVGATDCIALRSNQGLRIIKLDSNSYHDSLSLNSPALRWVRCKEDKLKALTLTLQSEGRMVVILHSLTTLTAVRISGPSIENGNKTKALARLSLSGCPALTTLKLQYVKQLDWLEIKDCPRFTTISGLGNLVELTLICCNMKLVERSFKSLRKLQRLVLETTLDKLPASLSCLASLSGLTLRRCTATQSLLGCLNPLQRLQQLSLEQASCEELDFGSCPSSVTSLSLRSCSRIRALPDHLFSRQQLAVLTIEQCPALDHLPDAISSLSALSSLTLRGCSAVRTLPSCLAAMQHLRELWLEGCPSLQGVAPPASLTRLHLESCHCCSLLSLPQLVNLTVLRCTGLQHVHPPATLRHLRLERCQSLCSVLGLAAPRTAAAAAQLPTAAGAAKLLQLCAVVISRCPHAVPRPCPDHLPSSFSYMFDGIRQPCDEAATSGCRCLVAAVS